MTNETCPWELFDNEERYTVTEQLYITGILSTFMGIWIILVFCHPSYKDSLTYRNISLFFKYAVARRCGPLVMGYIIPIRSTYRTHPFLCNLFGASETFMAVFEVEMLTHICIERYVVVKYITQGKPIEKRHYLMYHLLSLGFAAFYSVGMFFLQHGYASDYTCTSCTMNVILPEGWPRYYAAGIFALRSIKPVAVMLVMLYWATQLLEKLPDTPNNAKEQRLTQDAMALTAINLVCWGPIFLVRGLAVLSQLVYGPDTMYIPYATSVQIALLAHWGSPINSFAILYCTSPELRQAVGELRPQHIISALLR